MSRDRRRGIIPNQPDLTSDLTFDTRGDRSDDTPPESPRFHGPGDGHRRTCRDGRGWSHHRLAGDRRAGNALPKSPTDKVTLGKTGIQVSLIGMGTGSIGSGQASNQTRLGVKGFTRVVRHALDHGIRFFDVADQYGSHVYLREALKGVPRDQYVIQTKTHATNVPDARSHLERYRLELGVDYIDIVLLHCMQKAGWPAENQGSMEYLMKAKEEKIIRAHGTSCHGMDPLAHLGQEPVRRSRSRQDQSRRPDHG